MTFPLFLPLPPTDVLQIPDYLRRLNVAIQSFSTEIDAAIAAVSDHGALTGLSDPDHVAASVNFTATDKVLGRLTTGAGAGEEIACTAAGRAILDDANAAAQRTTLGAAPNTPKFFLNETPGSETPNASLLQASTGLIANVVGSTVSFSVAYVPINEVAGNSVYTGVRGNGTCGETVAIGDIVYFQAADSRWWKAKADTAANGGGLMLAMMLEAGTAGQSKAILYWGCYTKTGWGLTTGSLYYLDTATAGAMTTTAPSTAGHQVRALGYALSATVFFFRPTVDFGEKS